MTDIGVSTSIFNVRIVLLRFFFGVTCGREEAGMRTSNYSDALSRNTVHKITASGHISEYPCLASIL